MIKGANLTIVTDALFLRRSDSYENEDIVSIVSDTSVVVIFIFKKVTNFLYWNCRRFKNKQDEIRGLTSDHWPIFFPLQETYSTNHDKVTFHGYSSFRKDYHFSERATGGVALPISNDFPYNASPLNINTQAVAIQILVRQSITACIICLPLNYPLQKHELNNLIMQVSTPFVILGNFYAHNPLYGGSLDTNVSF